MFKKISPNVRLSGGSVCGSGYPVTHPVLKNGVTIYSDVPIKDSCPELGPPDHYSLEAQQKAGIPIQPVQTDLLSPSGDANTVFNQLTDKLNKQTNEDE